MEQLDEITSEDQAPGQRPAGPSRPLSPRRPLALLGAAVAAILIAALVYSLIELSSQNGTVSRLNRVEALRAGAVQAASSYGVYFSSYDYRDLSGPTAPWTEVESHSTPAFRKDFETTDASLATLITDYKATARGTVQAAAAATVSTTRAVVLLFLNQTVTNSTQKSGPQVTQFRIEMTLLRQNGKWLIDNVQASL
jgi:Mce-associated membrane protein